MTGMIVERWEQPKIVFVRFIAHALGLFTSRLVASFAVIPTETEVRLILDASPSITCARYPQIQALSWSITEWLMWERSYFKSCTYKEGWQGNFGWQRQEGYQKKWPETNPDWVSVYFARILFVPTFHLYMNRSKYYGANREFRNMHI